MFCEGRTEYVSREHRKLYKLRTLYLATQNGFGIMCRLPTRDISHITPIVAGVSGGVALIAVIIRCIYAVGTFQVDDMSAVAAIAIAVPFGALEFALAADGFGKDIWTIPHANIYRIIKARALYMPKNLDTNRC